MSIFRSWWRLEANPCSCGSTDLSYKEGIPLFYGIICNQCKFISTNRSTTRYAIVEWNKMVKNKNFNAPVPIRKGPRNEN